jgi:RimJ/RimL family protein N-acetyltransferase
MLTCLKIEDATIIQSVREDYLRTLVAPMDGMWEGTAIEAATFWELQDQQQPIGHFCTSSDNYLLRFYLLTNYQQRAQEILRWIVSTYRIQYAVTSTIEPFYFSLCLDMQISIIRLSYLFRDNKRIELTSGLNSPVFKAAEKSELDTILRFYRANAEGGGAGLEAFVQKRIDRDELFVLYDQQLIVAIGECIPSQRQLPYVDLGMVVAQAYRSRGLGSFMLSQLKQTCYAADRKPICACAIDNYASKKAIEKAGFISEQRMVQMQFPKSESV